MQAIIFLAPLAFNQVLEEDPRVNRLVIQLSQDFTALSPASRRTLSTCGKKFALALSWLILPWSCSSIRYAPLLILQSVGITNTGVRWTFWKRTLKLELAFRNTCRVMAMPLTILNMSPSVSAVLLTAFFGPGTDSHILLTDFREKFRAYQVCNSTCITNAFCPRWIVCWLNLSYPQKRLSPKHRPFFCHETSAIVSTTTHLLIESIAGIVLTHYSLHQDTRATSAILMGGKFVYALHYKSFADSWLYSSRRDSPQPSSKDECNIIISTLFLLYHIYSRFSAHPGFIVELCTWLPIAVD